MATKYAEFPVEETDKFIYGGAPVQAPAQASAQVQVQSQAPGPVTPTAPSTPVAKAPNVTKLVNQVIKAQEQLQEQTPAPQPQSAASNLVGDITKNWQSLLPLAAIPAAWFAIKAMGGGDGNPPNTPPNTPPNNPPNNPPKSIADRTIRKIEPLMDVNQAPVTGRIEPEFGKPTTESVVKITPKDPIEKMLLERYEAQQAAKKTPKFGEQEFKPSTPASAETSTSTTTETTKQEPPKLKRAEQTAINEVNKAKNQYLNLFGYQAKAPDSARSTGAVDAYNNMVEKQFGGVPPRNIPNDPIRPVGLPGGYQQYVEFLNRNFSELPSATQEHVNKSRTKGQVGNVEKLIAAGVPLSQQGSAGAKSMAGLVGLAGLTALSSSPEARAAMGRAQSAIQDLGISPDIFAGKGEEMGRLGKGYVTAGNPQYRAQIAEQLKVEKDPERRQLLLEEFQKAGGSGAGRGVAPPSEYMR